MQQQLEQTTEITTALPTLHGPGYQSKDLTEEIQKLTRANAKLKADLEQAQWQRQQLEKQLSKGEQVTVKEFHPRTVISSDSIPDYFWERLEWEQISGWVEIALFIFRRNQTNPDSLPFYDAVVQTGLGQSDVLRPPYEDTDADEVWNDDLAWDNCLKNLPFFTEDQLLTLAFWGVKKLVDDANQLKELEAFDETN